MTLAHCVFPMKFVGVCSTESRKQSPVLAKLRMCNCCVAPTKPPSGRLPRTFTCTPFPMPRVPPHMQICFADHMICHEDDYYLTNNVMRNKHIREADVLVINDVIVDLLCYHIQILSGCPDPALLFDLCHNIVVQLLCYCFAFENNYKRKFICVDFWFMALLNAFNYIIVMHALTCQHSCSILGILFIFETLKL